MTVLQPISDLLLLWGLGTFMLLGMTTVAVTRRSRRSALTWT